MDIPSDYWAEPAANGKGWVFDLKEARVTQIQSEPWNVVPILNIRMGITGFSTRRAMPWMVGNSNRKSWVGQEILTFLSIRTQCHDIRQFRWVTSKPGCTAKRSTSLKRVLRRFVTSRYRNGAELGFRLRALSNATRTQRQSESQEIPTIPKWKDFVRWSAQQL